jgi:hypothetical protein
MLVVVPLPSSKGLKSALTIGTPRGHQGLRVAVFFDFVPSLFLVLYELSLILCSRKFKILRYCHPHVVSIRNVMALTQSWIKRSMWTAEMEKKTKVTSSFFCQVQLKTEVLVALFSSLAWVLSCGWNQMTCSLLWLDIVVSQVSRTVFSAPLRLKVH